MKFISVNSYDPQQMLLYQMFKCLRPREKSILIYHYGLFGIEKHSLVKVSRIFKTSWVTIKKLERKALDKLRTCKDLYKIEDEGLLGALVGFCDCGCVYKKGKKHWHIGMAFVCDKCFEERMIQG